MQQWPPLDCVNGAGTRRERASEREGGNKTLIKKGDSKNEEEKVEKKDKEKKCVELFKLLW